MQKVPWHSGRDLPGDTARYCRMRATVSELSRCTSKERLGCVILKLGMSTMLGKMMIGLAALAIVSAATTMSASAQQKPTPQKKVRVTIPKEVCETLSVGTQNWGQQTVQVCGPPGARGQATLKQRQTQNR